MKICKMCEIELNEGNSKKNYRQCKSCISKKRKIYEEKVKDRRKQQAREYGEKNKEKIAIISRRHYLNNKEKKAQQSRDNYLKNKEKYTETIKIYRENHKDYLLEKQREYSKNNRGKINAKCAKRRYGEINRTPQWLTKEHIKEIKSFYIEAKRLEKEDGIKRHVDHIIPLQGKEVSGLHVPWNLQILTAFENISKSNKLILEVSKGETNG